MRGLLVSLLFLGILGVLWSYAVPHQDPKGMDYVTVKAHQSAAYIMLSPEEADHTKIGDMIEFENGDGEQVTGAILSIHPWFHRYMAKVGIKKPDVAMLLEKSVTVRKRKTF